MQYPDIEKDLDFFEGEVFFVSMMPEFIWCNAKKEVVHYASAPDLNNDLSVISTDLIEITTNLQDYLEEKDVQKNDVLVFCINNQFFPQNDKKYIRLTIIKNPKKNEFKRVSSSSLQNKQRLRF